MSSIEITSSQSTNKQRVCDKCKQTYTGRATKATSVLLEFLKQKNPKTSVEKLRFCRPCALALKERYEKKMQASTSSIAGKSLIDSQPSTLDSQGQSLKRKSNQQSGPAKKRPNLNIMLSQSLESSQGSSEHTEVHLDVITSTLGGSSDSSSQEIETAIVEPVLEEIEPVSREPEVPQTRDRTIVTASGVYIAPTPVRMVRRQDADLPVYRHLNGG